MRPEHHIINCRFVNQIANFNKARNRGYHTKHAHLGLLSATITKFVLAEWVFVFISERQTSGRRKRLTHKIDSINSCKVTLQGGLLNV